MIDCDQRTRFLAAGLSALAGFVDALGFMQLGGNSTRLGVGQARASSTAAVAAAALTVVAARLLTLRGAIRS